MTEFLHDVVRERNLNQNAINNPDPWGLDEGDRPTYIITDRGLHALHEEITYGRGPY